MNWTNCLGVMGVDYKWSQKLPNNITLNEWLLGYGIIVFHNSFITPIDSLRSSVSPQHVIKWILWNIFIGKRPEEFVIIKLLNKPHKIM